MILSEIADISFAYCGKYDKRRFTTKVFGCKPSDIKMFGQDVVDRYFDAWLPESYIERYRLLKGDIVAKTNGFNPIAVTESPEATLVLVGSNAFRIRPHADKVIPTYLWAVLAEKSKGFCEKNKKITRSELEGIEIVLPDPVEQEEWLQQFTKLKIQEQSLWASLA